jgi:hypothetical protein
MEIDFTLSTEMIIEQGVLVVFSVRLVEIIVFLRLNLCTVTEPDGFVNIDLFEISDLLRDLLSNSLFLLLPILIKIIQIKFLIWLFFFFDLDFFAHSLGGHEFNREMHEFTVFLNQTTETTLICEL